MNEQLTALFHGEEVELPRYDFPTGTSQKSGRRLRLGENEILVVEGIHALNPELTSQIPEDQIFRVYASALTTILLDNHNYIPTTDNRLLRRIIRDHKYRAVSAQETIRRWPSVRAGCPEHAEAYRLLKFLRYIKPIPDTMIPPTSLIREFLGGSSFKY